MSCTLCTSDNQAEFTAESMIHFSGHGNINNPGVLSLSKVSVCLDCGFSEFTIPEAELQKLKAGNAQSTNAA